MSRALKALALFFAFAVLVTIGRKVLTTTTTTTTSTSTTTSSVTSTTATTAACQGSDFSGQFVQGQGAAGTIYGAIVLTKSAPGQCAVDGWPRLVLQDRYGATLTSSTVDVPGQGSSITFPDTRANQAPARLVLLQGDKVTFSLAYTDVPVGTETCSAAQTISVQVGTATSTTPVTPQYPPAPCDHGRVWVSPLYRANT